MKRFLKINGADNVAAVLADGVKAGEWFEDNGTRVHLLADVPRGHKFALRDIASGEDVVKYGSPIGHADSSRRMGAFPQSGHIAQ